MGKAIGIDFGTTNTVVSYLNKKGHFRQLKHGSGNGVLIPTAIYFNTKDDYVIGAKARAKHKMHPAAYVDRFKTRLSGTNVRPYEIVAENGDERKLSPRMAMTYFLNRLIKDVNDQLQSEFGITEGKVDRAVITVPAKFGTEEIAAIKAAAMKALSIRRQDIKVVFEPTAAARAAHEDEGEQNGETVLIYDFGGGTFDVSLMRYENHKYTQLYTDGDKFLGGNALTDKLSEMLMKSANDEYGTDFTMDEADYDPNDFDISKDEYDKNIDAIWNAANQAKEDLSDVSEVDVDFNFYHGHGESDICCFSVTRQELNRLIEKSLIGTADITARTADKASGKIDRIIMAGGSSRIPIIKDLLSKRLGRDDVEVSEDVSTLISRGAAMFAQSIEDIENMTEQTTANQIGVAVTEGIQFNKFRPIIKEGVKLPASGTENFKLLEDNLNSLNVTYYEYDIRNYPNAVFVDELGIEEAAVVPIELPPNLKKDETIIKVTFSVQTDGTMEFAAEVLDLSGKKIADGKTCRGRNEDLI